MKTESLTIQEIFEDNKLALQLQWVSGKETARVLDACVVSPADLIGHLNFIHPNRIQVVGCDEIRYALAWGKEKRQHKMTFLFQSDPPAIIVAENAEVVDFLRAASLQYEVPLWTSAVSSAKVIDYIRSYLFEKLARITYMHGVFMDVFGMGTLITGDAGIGKSELALELISRRHSLVADDSVQISCVGPNILVGQAPDLLKHYLEVRGLGILNIRSIFGETSVRPHMKVRLVVHLYKAQHDVDHQRLQCHKNTQNILGTDIRRIELPVAVGRNLAVLIEAAVRKYILEIRGYEGELEFIHAQEKSLQSLSVSDHQPAD